MRKIIQLVLLVLIAVSFQLEGQDYNITFAILGSIEKPASVKVENTTMGTENTLTGNDVLYLVKDISTSIGDINADADNVLKVYPNPVIENATIVFNNPVKGQVNVRVVNMAGKQIASLSTVLPQGEVSYALSVLSAGCYVVHVQSADYRSSCVILSQTESVGKPGITISNINAIAQQQTKTQSKLKLARVTGKTIKMQYNAGDVLKFTATLNTKNATLSDYIATKDDEIEFSFTYTVTFNNWDNSEISTFEGEFGDAVTYPSHPNNRDGYTAKGWSTANATLPANDDLVITAQYNAVPYHITYHNIGTKNAATNPATYTIEDNITLAGPSDSTGFTFGGWFTDAAFTNVVSNYSAITQGSTGDTAFYAKWASNPLTDSRDGKVYQTVAIGNQIWMAENLAYLPEIQNNDDFTTKGNNSEPAYGVYGFDGYKGCDVATAKANENYKNYGVLYNWYVIDQTNVCPSGWHVPSDTEFIILERELGMTQSESYDEGYDRGTDQGAQLAGKADLWLDGELEASAAFGSSGFNAVPGGMRFDGSYASFRGAGNSCYLWSSTEFYKGTSHVHGPYAYHRYIYFGYVSVSRSTGEKTDGCSVRCLKD
jgi:uncharacterized protein (TIGR02145 family)/uncharacterized repeat protein (TIGR02543 family)